MLFFVKGPTAAAHVRARGPDEGRAASGRTAAAHGCRRAAAVAADGTAAGKLVTL